MRAKAAWRDVLLLSALCGLVYFTGLTTRGLSNWQEAQRALAAREMQERGDWIVPTINGKPYLAKPPLFYWCQLVIAELRGGRAGELDLRLTVALAGWLGVLATYVVTRRLLEPRPLHTLDEANAGDADYPRRAAFWASLFLATGVLYVRRSRIGELDIVLAPLTVIAVGALYAAWRSHVERGRTHWAALLVATLAGAGATLAKGPPALLPIALAGYGGMALAPLMRRMLRGSDAPASNRPLLREARVRLGALIGAIGFVAGGIASSWSESSSSDRALGSALFAVMGLLLGGFVGAMASREYLLSLWRALTRTHPIAVLGLPALALWAWLWAARARVGDAFVMGTIDTEARDNLRLFLLESPVNNLEAATYAVGIGSALSLAAWGWLVLGRPRIAPGLAFAAAWAVLSLIAFSTLGKGVARYLTPVWPAVAILGGAWFAWRPPPRGRPWPLAVRMPVYAAVAMLAVAQGVWYGALGAKQSLTPREFIAELLGPSRGVDPARLGMFEFDTPQVDYYVGGHVESFLGEGPHPDLIGVGPRTLTDLARDLHETGETFTLLVRRTTPKFMQDTPPALDRIRDAGLIVEEVPMTREFFIDNGRTPIGAYRVRAR
ncbi:MAG: ArnT family glycosyltransferase [Phycisphaerales bacterium]